MTQKIPPEIRGQVLTLWLQAFSRDDIAKDLGIGAGTVSEIIKSYKKHDPESELAREFVLALKGQGSNINQFASSVRLQRLLERVGLVGEQIESFVRDAARYCFLKEMDVKKFIELAHEVSSLAEKSGIDLQKLPEQIQEKERELYMVTMDLSSKKAERKQALNLVYRHYQNSCRISHNENVTRQKLSSMN
ncbi:MAG: hypothetical protein K0S89_655 [Nitrososphaeraceae archaeon]|jgi:predicted transcriptional regulator|nr:hypothetical protein [Nitrososphaeraceae archaeon]